MSKSTDKKTEKKTENQDSVQETMKNTMEGYFDGIADSSEKFAESVSNARARNTRIMDKFIETIASGQKDMLELGRAITAAPTDYKANLQLTMETMNRRQECALEFGKTLFREQTEMTSEASENTKELFAPFKTGDFDWTAPYRQMSKFWTPNAS